MLRAIAARQLPCYHWLASGPSTAAGCGAPGSPLPRQGLPTGPGDGSSSVSGSVWDEGLCCCSHSKGESYEPQTSPLSSSPASPRGSSALSGHDGALAPALGPAVGDACQEPVPTLGRDQPRRERGLEPGQPLRAAPQGSLYLLQVLVREQQILILFLQEQQPQFVHLQKERAPLRDDCGARALGWGALPAIPLVACSRSEVWRGSLSTEGWRHEEPSAPAAPRPHLLPQQDSLLDVGSVHLGLLPPHLLPQHLGLRLCALERALQLGDLSLQPLWGERRC